MMILELHRQGVSISAIARRTGHDPKTVRKYVERGVEAPAYGPRSVGRPSKLAPFLSFLFLSFLGERIAASPDLIAARQTREIRAMGDTGAYTAVKRHLAAIRPEQRPKPYEVRFETPPGVQAQVDFARFVVDFTDDPGTSRIGWLFSLVLGHSRFLFARYVMHQDLQTLKDKRAEVHGRIAAYEAQIAQAKHDLAHINATIGLFTDPEKQRARYMVSHGFFKKGEIADICVRHLEVDGEMTTRQLAERVMVERKLDASDTTLRNSVVFKVVQALRHAKRRKLVRMVDKRQGMCVWAAGDAVTLRVVANSPSKPG